MVLVVAGSKLSGVTKILVTPTGILGRAFDTDMLAGMGFRAVYPYPIRTHPRFRPLWAAEVNGQMATTCGVVELIIIIITAVQLRGLL